jgi:hypothetical protein
VRPFPSESTVGCSALPSNSCTPSASKHSPASGTSNADDLLALLRFTDALSLRVFPARKLATNDCEPSYSLLPVWA